MTFSGDSTTFPGSVLASSALAAFMSSRTNSLAAAPSSLSLELFNAACSVSPNFFSSTQTFPGASSPPSFFSSANACCCPSPNPSVISTVPKLSFGFDSSVLTISEFFTSLTLLGPSPPGPAAPAPSGNSSSGLLRFWMLLSRLPLDLPGCSRSIVRWTVSRFCLPSWLSFSLSDLRLGSFGSFFCEWGGIIGGGPRGGRSEGGGAVVGTVGGVGAGVDWGFGGCGVGIGALLVLLLMLGVASWSFGCFAGLTTGGSFGVAIGGGADDRAAANGGGSFARGERMIGGLSASSGGICANVIGLRKSAASILAVTASRSSIMYREGELLAELYSLKRGVFSSHLLMSLRVCSVSSSRASMLAPLAAPAEVAPPPLDCLLVGVLGGLVAFALPDFCDGFFCDSDLVLGGFGGFSTGEGTGEGIFGVTASVGESSTKSYSSLGSAFLSGSTFSSL
uniref:(northern house mosquito) hypothetical protein n=1 Tax=Culex pipiens TaxID=7175 RepID=A0A8D8FL94_CULPI